MAMERLGAHCSVGRLGCGSLAMGFGRSLVNGVEGWNWTLWPA